MSFGLSADTEYADRIRELSGKKFLTNSDAHSLPKIAREYNTFEMENISFETFKKVLGYEDEIQNNDNNEVDINKANKNIERFHLNHLKKFWDMKKKKVKVKLKN